MAPQQVPGSLPTGTVPHHGQLGELAFLHGQRVLGGTHRGVECQAVPLQRAEIHPVLGAVPVADLGCVHRQVRMLIAEQMTGPDVVLQLLHGRPSLRQT